MSKSSGMNIRVRRAFTNTASLFYSTVASVEASACAPLSCFFFDLIASRSQFLVLTENAALTSPALANHIHPLLFAP